MITWTTIVAFVMVFVLQNTQCRGTQAMRLKPDEPACVQVLLTGERAFVDPLDLNRARLPCLFAGLDAHNLQTLAILVIRKTKTKFAEENPT